MEIIRNQIFRLQVKEDYVSKNYLSFLCNPIYVKIENINPYNFTFSLINDKVINDKVNYITTPHSQTKILVPTNKK